MPKKLKVGLFGVGHLGKIHAKILHEISGYELIGFFDPDTSKVSEARQMGLIYFDNPEKLINESDVVDVVCNTSAHFEVAMMAAKAGKHLFIEKPLTETIEQAAQLVQVVEESRVVAMVGHVERFNPAMLCLDISKIQPVFIEVHRLAMFNARGTDVSVVHDLMIHDIDIILSLVKSSIYKVHASGVAILSHTPDIANARIEFENGCIANLTASRISLKNMRKMRIFQKGAYISMDFLQGKSDVVKLCHRKPVSEIPSMEVEIAGAKKFISMQTVSKKDVNAIRFELEQFHRCVLNKKRTPVTIEDGYRAMVVAQQIMDAIHKHSSRVRVN
jgi:predicted dehydrogenase